MLEPLHGRRAPTAVSQEDVRRRMICRSARRSIPRRSRGRSRASIRSTRPRGYYLAKHQRRHDDGRRQGQARFQDRTRAGGSPISGVEDPRQQQRLGRRDRRRDEDEAGRIPLVQKGEFDDDKFAGDLGERIPDAVREAGYIDFQIVPDTLIIDRAHGKALIELTVDRRTAVHGRHVRGRRATSASRPKRSAFYPFSRAIADAHQRATGLVRRATTDRRTSFDQAEWDDATQKLRTAYSNEGYIYAHPAGGRAHAGGGDSAPDGQSPLGDRREDAGDRSTGSRSRATTTRRVVHSRALVILPGDVFNQDRLIRSYQNIANLGFFETPMPPPDTRPANDQGDVDIIFHVKEKRTGNVNFGASIGQGTGVGGFIGLDQPNLFGRVQARVAAVAVRQVHQRFQLTYTDPHAQPDRASRAR